MFKFFPYINLAVNERPVPQATSPVNVCGCLQLQEGPKKSQAQYVVPVMALATLSTIKLQNNASFEDLSLLPTKNLESPFQILTRCNAIHCCFFFRLFVCFCFWFCLVRWDSKLSAALVVACFF